MNQIHQVNTFLLILSSLILPSTFIYSSKLNMSAYSINEVPIFHKMKYDFKWHFYVLERLCVSFTFIPSDLITTLTYFFMDNFFPCFFVSLNKAACIFVIFLGEVDYVYIFQQLAKLEYKVKQGSKDSFYIYTLLDIHYKLFIRRKFSYLLFEFIIKLSIVFIWE